VRSLDFDSVDRAISGWMERHFRPTIRIAILLLFLQMPGTMLPLIPAA
jgi:hypothetical protein